MKKSSLKQLLLSLSLCISLLCYPYADVLMHMTATLAQVATVVMTFSAMAIKILQSKKQARYLDIQPNQTVFGPIAIGRDSDVLVLMYSLRNNTNKVEYNSKQQTVTTSRNAIQAPQAEQVKQAADRVTVTADRVAIKSTTSSEQQQSTLGSTFKPTIGPDVTAMADRALGSHNQYNASHTIELINAAQEDVPLQVPTNNIPSYDQQSTQHTTGSQSNNKSHQQILQESQQNSDAIDSAVHYRQGRRMSETQRNNLALKIIRANATLSYKFDQQYESFLNMIERCTHIHHKDIVLGSLHNLATPENYDVLKRVPYLKQGFDKIVGTLHHLCLNKDGSLRSGEIIGHEVEVTRALAEFIMPLNGTSADYISIVEQLAELHIRGAQQLRQELENYYAQSRVFQFMEFFETKTSHAPITQKFLTNPFNQDMFALLRECKAERWDRAKTIADRYQAEFDEMKATGQWNETVRNNAVASQALFYRLAYDNGIFKKYTAHPAYQQLLERLYPNTRADEVANQQLEAEYVISKVILEQLGITRPSPVVKHLVYRLAPINYDPVAVNTTLSCLSKDHADGAIREAYDVFYDEHGICRLMECNQERLQGVTIPACINNEAYTKERVTLNILLKVDTSDPTVKAHVQEALRYIQHACQDAALKEEYSAIAATMCDAIIVQEADATILSLGDFTELCQTESQRLERPSLMRDAVMLCEKINQPDISDEVREDYRKKLCIVEITRKRLLTLHKDKQSLLNVFYNEKIRPFLEIVGAYNLGITYAQFIYNELATPIIPDVGVLMKDGGQQNEGINQTDIPPQPAPDPEDPKKKKELPSNPDDSDKAKQLRRGAAIEEIFRNAFGKKKKCGGPCKQYQKKGSFDTAKKDFDSLELNNVKDVTNHKGPKFVGEMPNGQKVIVRSHSSGEENLPTLEFQPKPGSDKTEFKIRYTD